MKKMQKVLAAIVCAAVAVASAGCNTSGTADSSSVSAGGYNPAGNMAENTGAQPGGQEDTAVNENNPAMLTVEQLLALTPQKMLSCAGYDEEKFLTPFYRSQIQYNEGFFLLENEAGGVDDVSFAFPVKKILEIRSNDLNTVYREGEDYVLNDDGTVSIPAGSAIRPLSRSEFFTTGGQWKWDTAAGTVINTTAAMYKGQYVCTYIRTDEYEGYTANACREELTAFREKTDAGEKVEILVLGDSIAAGAGRKDFDSWADMVADGISWLSGSKTELFNAAVPGIHSGEYVALIDWNPEKSDNPNGVAAGILEDAKKKFAITQERKSTADLVIIGIGGNDAGGWCGANGTAVSTYSANVEKMISYIREANPDCSILLVSCMQTNPKIVDAATGNKLAAADFGAYEAALKEIADARENVGLANVYGVERGLLERKQIEDMLGDNINHPSDYMARVYAQVILASLFDL